VIKTNKEIQEKINKLAGFIPEGPEEREIN